MSGSRAVPQCTPKHSHPEVPQDRPDLSVATRVLSQKMSGPTGGSEMGVKRVVRDRSIREEHPSVDRQCLGWVCRFSPIV